MQYLLFSDGNFVGPYNTKQEAEKVQTIMGFGGIILTDIDIAQNYQPEFEAFVEEYWDEKRRDLNHSALSPSSPLRPFFMR